MKRYGNSLLFNCQGELVNEHDKMVQVIYGECGVRYGIFAKPAEIPKKRKTVNIFSLLKFGRKKPKGHGD